MRSSSSETRSTKSRITSSGGHIAAQALMAASRTVPDRLPHNMQLYFLRAGDARQPVDFEVTALLDGGSFFTGGHRAPVRAVLLEGIASFSASVESHRLPTAVTGFSATPNPCRASPSNTAITRTNGTDGGCASSPSTMRYVDPSARLASDIAETPPARIRMWCRPNGIAPVDPVIADCLARSMSPAARYSSRRWSPAARPRWDRAFRHLMNLAVWFHHPPDLSDWLLYQQHSPSGIGGRGLGPGDHVQPHRRTGVHHDAGVLLRQQEERLARGHRPRRAQRRPAASTSRAGRACRAAARAGGAHLGEALEKRAPAHFAFGAGERGRRGRNAVRRRTPMPPALGRSMSKRCGSGKTAGSRLAAARGRPPRNRRGRSGMPASSVSSRATRAVSCTGDSSRRISSTAFGHSSGRSHEGVADCPGLSSSMRIPLPNKFTVVSNPAAKTRPATPEVRPR